MKMRIEDDWYTDQKVAAGIKVRSDIRSYGNGHGEGFFWKKLKDLTVFACYISPNAKEDIFQKLISDLRRAVRNSVSSAIVGDLSQNTKNGRRDPLSSEGLRLQTYP